MPVKHESERQSAINANIKEATQTGHLDTLQVHQQSMQSAYVYILKIP